MVGVCDRRLIGAFLDGDVNRAVARVAPVGHADRDRVLAGRVPGIDDFNVAVFVGVHRHPRGGGRASQEEGVSVGVHPVRQPVDGGPTSLTQGDGGHDLLHGRLVDVVAVDGQRHVGLRGSAPPIRDLVIEGRRARRVLVDGDLQGRTLSGDTDLPEGGLRERRGRHEVAVGVGIVHEDRKDHGLSCAHPEVVVHGLGRRVVLVAVGCDRVVDVVDGLVLGFFLRLEFRFQLIPVVDQDHVGVGQPQAVLLDVVEDDDVTIGAENSLFGAREGVDDHLPVICVGGAIPHERAGCRPGRIRALVVRDRAGGVASGGGCRHGRRAPAANGNPDESVGGGEQDLVRLRPGVLEDDALTVNALRLAARQVERGSVPIPDDHVGSDGRDLQVVGGADARQGCGLGVCQRAALQQRRHAPSLGGHRVDVALRVHGRDRAGYVRNTGVRIVRVDGRGVVCLLHPHLAVGRVRDRDCAAAHVRGHPPVVHCRRQGGRCDVNGRQRVGRLIGELDLLAVLEDVEG